MGPMTRNRLRWRGLGFLCFAPLRRREVVRVKGVHLDGRLELWAEMRWRPVGRLPGFSLDSRAGFVHTWILGVFPAAKVRRVGPSG